MSTRGFSFGLYNPQTSQRKAYLSFRALALPNAALSQDEANLLKAKLDALRAMEDVAGIVFDADYRLAPPKTISVLVHKEIVPLDPPQRDRTYPELKKFHLGSVDAKRVNALFVPGAPALKLHAVGATRHAVSVLSSSMRSLVRERSLSAAAREHLTEALGGAAQSARDRMFPPPSRYARFLRPGGQVKSETFTLGPREVRQCTLRVDLTDRRASAVYLELCFEDTHSANTDPVNELTFVFPTEDQVEQAAHPSPLQPQSPAP